MVVSFTPHLNFSSKSDSPLPESIEAEEAVLGGILLDPGAIYRIKDKLKPQHFYISAHREIYKAATKMARRNQPTDLLALIDYLKSKNKLSDIGGRNKLANLVDRTVSAVNIDYLADLIIEKYTRRQIISFGHEFLDLGHEVGIELSEVIEEIKNKSEIITESSFGKSQDEIDVLRYQRLLAQLKEIHLGISDPGLKFFKLQELARGCGRTVRDLDNIYQKSLCGKIGERLTLDELEESIEGESTREFLIGGLVPKNTSVLVYADGGVGKTKFLYDLAYCMATGKNWNNFPVTATNRRILIYQGDESKRDMLQALNKRGFKKGSDSRDQIQTRFGWNFDAIPALVKDIEEFKPDIVFIDSLTYANRYSIYDENRTEYARPVLELTSIAEEYGVTVVIVHHSSRGSGKPRGTTAIFNAVSEVCKLEKDTSPGANVQEKVLTIEKSRSRRFPCSYKMIFDEEDFSLHLLEEVGSEISASDSSTKDRIVEFLLENKNNKFESEEIAHHIGSSWGNTRRYCSKLHRDGLISCDELSESGTKKLYYIPFEERDCSIYESTQNNTKTSSPWFTSEKAHKTDGGGDDSDLSQCINKGRSPGDRPLITSGDHLCNSYQEGDLRKGDHSVHENSEKKFQKKMGEKGDQVITFPGNADSASNPEGDQGRRSPKSESDHPVENFFELYNSNVVYKVKPHPSFAENKTNTLKVMGITGDWKVKFEICGNHIDIEYCSSEKSGKQSEFIELSEKLTFEGFRSYVESAIWELEKGLVNDCTFSVQVWTKNMDELEPKEVKGCKLITVPKPPDSYFAFTSPSGRIIHKFGVEEFKMEVE
ncbi:MAG: DnaB-like helicase N-terminal domain-containing protein [Cyanobacteria bacterium P01_D01_bin.50]